MQICSFPILRRGIGKTHLWRYLLLLYILKWWGCNPPPPLFFLLGKKMKFYWQHLKIKIIIEKCVPTNESLPRLLGMWPEMAVLYSTLSLQEKAVVPCLIYWMQIDLRCENSIEAQRNCISFLFLVFKGPIFCNSTELDSFNFVQFLFLSFALSNFFLLSFSILLLLCAVAL